MKKRCLGTTQSNSEYPERQPDEKRKKMFVFSIHTSDVCCISISYKRMNKTVLVLMELTFWCRKTARVQVSKSRKYTH